MQVNLTEILIAIIGIVFTGIVIPLVRIAFIWLKEKTKNEALKSAIDEAKTVADSAVATIQAALVDGLKEKSKDGKLSAEEARDAMNKAIELCLDDLSERTKITIIRNTESIGTFLANLLEARLLKIK